VLLFFLVFCELLLLNVTLHVFFVCGFTLDLFVKHLLCRLKNRNIITSLQFPVETGCSLSKKVKFPLSDLCGVSDKLPSQGFYL
jgi:hypothetical protein